MRVCGRIKSCSKAVRWAGVCRRKRSPHPRVLIVIGDFQPFAFFRRAHAKDMPLQRNTSASFSRSAAFNISSGSTRMVSHPRQRRAAISFLRYIAGNFKTETEVTLFAMSVVIFKPSRQRRPKCSINVVPSASFSPKGVGKTAGRAENLYRDVVTLPSVYQLPARRDREDYPHNQELSNQSCWGQAQAAPDNLLVKTHRFGRAQNGDKIDVRGVKSGGQYRDVDQIAKTLGFKIFNYTSRSAPGVSPVNQCCIFGRQ